MPPRTILRALVLALCLALVLPGAGALAEDEGANRAASPLDELVPAEEAAERCGLDPDLLLAADVLLAANPYVVLRHGQLCWQGGHPLGHALPLPVFSITKTFGAVLVGVAAARSSLADTTLLTEWLDEDELGAVNPEATVAHVLAMTGTDPDLSAGNREPWTYDTFGDREIDLLVEVVDRVIAAEPDGFDGAADSVELAQQAIFDVLGMTDTTWPGGSIGAGMVSTPLDMAKLGELLLRRGRWGDRTVIEETFAYRMTHPSFEDSNTGYGYLTYLNAAEGWHYSTGTPDDTCSPYASWPRYPHAPLFEMDDPNGGTPFDVPATHDIGVVWASGAGGQRFVVHRGLDLVFAVRDSVVSTDPTDPGLFEGHKSVWAAIRPALVALDPDFAGDEDAFCEAYRRSEHAPDLREPWSAAASGPAAPIEEAEPTPEPTAEPTAEPVATTPDATPAATPATASPALPATGPVTPAAFGLLALLLGGLLLRRR
jgi:CubicO group peptidase (beta-lactamase class C family)